MGAANSQRSPHRQPTNWRHKMATLALEAHGEGTEGLPLQLTTITVAVPQPLSPGTVSVLQGGDCGAAQGFKWKYEQPKPEKQGSTLVSSWKCEGRLGRLNEEKRGVNDRRAACSETQGCSRFWQQPRSSSTLQKLDQGLRKTHSPSLQVSLEAWCSPKHQIGTKVGPLLIVHSSTEKSLSLEKAASVEHKTS